MDPGYLNWLWHQLAIRVVEALPWLAGIGLVGWSPLGRGLVGMMRSRQDEARLPDQLLAELGELKGMVGETMERLDFLERRLVQLSPPSQASERPVLPPAAEPSDRVTTPH